MCLQAGTISVSDFHQVLQEVTNFPLRPFVLPFLKANIPLLSRDVASLAVLTCQTPLQYLRSHQHLLLELPIGKGKEERRKEADGEEKNYPTGPFATFGLKIRRLKFLNYTKFVDTLKL